MVNELQKELNDLQAKLTEVPGLKDNYEDDDDDDDDNDI